MALGKKQGNEQMELRGALRLSGAGDAAGNASGTMAVLVIVLPATSKGQGAKQRGRGE